MCGSPFLGCVVEICQKLVHINYAEMSRHVSIDRFSWWFRSCKSGHFACFSYAGVVSYGGHEGSRALVFFGKHTLDECNIKGQPRIQDSGVKKAHPIKK